MRVALSYAWEPHHGNNPEQRNDIGPRSDVKINGRLYDVAVVFECSIHQDHYSFHPNSSGLFQELYHEEACKILECVTRDPRHCQLVNVLFFFIERERSDRENRARKRRAESEPRDAPVSGRLRSAK